MKLAAAPRRTARTWSVIGLTVLAVSDVILVLIHAFTDAIQLSVPWVLVVNAGASLVIAVFRFLKQTIPVSVKDKRAIVSAALDAPIIGAESD